ncbi:MAG: hypothetical protein ABI895_28700 [Deltaproteobacteria bacterium]
MESSDLQWKAFQSDPARSSLPEVYISRNLFFGNEQSGHDSVSLYTLVGSPEKHRVNAIVYLVDMLIRVQPYPGREIEELLPHRLKPPH